MDAVGAQNVMNAILDYEDSETGLRLVQTASDFVEPMNIFVGNGELKDGEATVGRTILTYHFETNAVEMSIARVEETATRQGFGSRYLGFVADELKAAGVRYFYADVNEAAASVVTAKGWTKEFSDLDLGENVYGLDLTK